MIGVLVPTVLVLKDAMEPLGPGAWWEVLGLLETCSWKAALLQPLEFLEEGCCKRNQPGLTELSLLPGSRYNLPPAAPVPASAHLLTVTQQQPAALAKEPASYPE